MHWKDFFHYQKSERAAIILLLILIVLALIFNILISRNQSLYMTDTARTDSLNKAFDEFRKNLIRKDSASVEEKREYAPKKKSDYRYSHRDSLYRRDNEPSETYTALPKTDKFSESETLSLNETDTAEWKKIPGIGSSYASRIVKYQNLLGGFYDVEQLREVYGIDNALFVKISPYIVPGGNIRKMNINKTEFKTLLSHPYLNYKQTQAIFNLRKKKGSIDSIDELSMLDEFTSSDLERLKPYLEF